MYTEAVPPARQAIAQAQHILSRVIETDEKVLKQSFAPNMFDFQTQLAVVAGFALRATYPLCGRAVPDLAEGADLVKLLQDVDAALATLTPDDFAASASGTIHHTAGEAELSQTAPEYLHLFALPNLWFHLSMAYGIARNAGVDLGKADFDGLHAYTPGFSFV